MMSNVSNGSTIIHWPVAAMMIPSEYGQKMTMILNSYKSLRDINL
jgi:hypothetical protein